MTKHTMRASYLHGIRDLRMKETSRPTPRSDQVLLKVAVVGVCGTDVHYYLEGSVGGKMVKEPIIEGHEFSAWVAGLGQNVEGLAVGQLVAVDPAIPCSVCEFCQEGNPNVCRDVLFCGTPPVNGVLAEYTVMPAENCFALPKELGPVEGALLEPLGVAIHSVDLAHLKAGQTVVVLGAGPIGLLTAAVAKTAGASSVYMTEPLAYRREFALDYVADAVFDPTTDDVVTKIQCLTGDRGVDVVFEAAGAPETPDQASAMVRPGGKVVIAGIPPDDRITLAASTVRRKGLTLKLVRRMKHTYPRTIRLVQQGVVNVTPLATHFFSLEQVTDAFETVAAYADGVIKAIVQVGVEPVPT